MLVVDSDAYRRTFLVQMLMETGRRVLMAGSEAEARSILSSLGARVDTVMVSPSPAGPELVRRLRAEWPKHRFVLIASDPSEPVPNGAAQLIRPITRDKLSALLD